VTVTETIDESVLTSVSATAALAATTGTSLAENAGNSADQSAKVYQGLVGRSQAPTAVQKGTDRFTMNTQAHIHDLTRHQPQAHPMRRPTNHAPLHARLSDRPCPWDDPKALNQLDDRCPSASPVPHR
jgi:hypothetical protein